MPKKRTNDEYKELIKSKYGNEYTLLSDYIKSTEKIHVRHNVCGTEWYPNAGDLLKKKICPVCGKKANFINIIKAPEQFKKEFNDLSNGEYELLSEYHRSSEKIKIRHITCGYEFKMTPNKFLAGQRCPNCRANKKKSKKDFEEEVCKLYGDEFTVFGEFINTYTKIDIKHNKCGHIINIKPSDFLSKKTYCKYCNQSALESLIEKALMELNIEYIYQKDFDDLLGIGGNKLLYDFYFQYNGKEYVVEGQGEQHYRKIEFFGGKDKFEKQQEHDKRKYEYAKSHDIRFIEIPYWEFKNIKNIISQNLALKTA